MGDWHYGMSWGWWVIGPLMMVLFWGGLFWLWVSITRSGNNRSSTPGGVSPLEIARSRLASGEIDLDEFEKIVERLDVGGIVRGTR